MKDFEKNKLYFEKLSFADNFERGKIVFFVTKLLTKYFLIFFF